MKKPKRKNPKRPIGGKAWSKSLPAGTHFATAIAVLPLARWSVETVETPKGPKPKIVVGSVAGRWFWLLKVRGKRELVSRPFKSRSVAWRNAERIRDLMAAASVEEER